MPLICDSLCPVHEAGSSLQSPCMVREELPAQHCPGHPALAECPAVVTVALKQPWRAGIPALSSPTANRALLGAEQSPPTPQPSPAQWEVTQSLGVPSPWLGDHTLPQRPQPQRAEWFILLERNPRFNFSICNSHTHTNIPTCYSIP